MHSCGSFPSETDGNPYFELPRRLSGSGQVRTGAGCSQGAVTQPLRVPRVDHQPAQESAVAQTASCLSGTILDSAQMLAWITPERSLTIQRLVPSVKPGTTRPLKVFQRLLCLIAATASVIPLGLLHMQPLQFRLKARFPPHAWRLGRLPVPNRNEVRPDLHKEGSHNGCVQLGLGAPCWRAIRRSAPGQPWSNACISTA